MPIPNKAGNYKGRKFTLEGWQIDPTVTAHTGKPWVHGKVCKRCGSTVRFAGPNRQCVRCLKQWRKEHRHKWARTPRDYDLRANPLYKKGFARQQYDLFFSLQRGVCAICQRKEKDGKRLSIDHCHDSGNFRGLLCNSCNRGLGLFKDDPTRLIAAARYLQENPWDL